MPLETVPVSAQDQRCAEAAVAGAQLLSDPARLEACLASLQSVSVVGLDTEFVRERSFFPRPGLVQISDGRSIFLLDAAALQSMPGLGRILAERLQVKVLHSVGEDLEVLRILTRALPQPLFDTQIAAAMLGAPLQCRYEHLVAQVLGVELPGGKARSDWCRRPLTLDLITYAAQDVIWLPRLQALLAEALERRGRLSWLEEDCARAVSAAADPETISPLLRVKGAGQLADEPLEMLERLAEWREQEARRRDLPRSFVIRDEALIGLAASRPGPMRERQLSALAAPVIRRHAGALAEILGGPPRSDFVRPSALVALDGEQRERIKTWQQAVASLASEIGLEPALLASRRELTRLVRGERPAWLDGWRGQLLSGLLGT